MTTVQTSPAEHVVVYDLASLRLVRRARRVEVRAADGQMLCSTVASTGASDRAVAYAAFDAALDATVSRSVVLADGPALVAARVALYNPRTAQVAVVSRDGRDRRSLVFGTGRALPLATAGTDARMTGQELELADVSLPLLAQDSRSVPSEVAAHREPVAV